MRNQRGKLFRCVRDRNVAWRCYVMVHISKLYIMIKYVFFPRDRITREAGSWIVLEPRMDHRRREHWIESALLLGRSVQCLSWKSWLSTLELTNVMPRHDGRADAW